MLVYAETWKPSMNIVQCLVFGSLISVLDPLAIFAVFKGVNAAKGNFFLIFGEALVGYGVAMELFKAFVEFDQDETIPISSYFYIAASTITDSVLGILIGMICGLVTAAITKSTFIECQYFEPLVTLGCALFGYLVCLDLGLSYIFATISCGLVQKRYTFITMSPRSSMSTKNIIFGLALLVEVLMFVLIGYFLVDVGFYDVWDFASAVILTIFIIRMFVRLGLSFLLNIFRVSAISFKWQLLLLFGGQKGPMSLAMALTYLGPFKKLFKETNLLVILISIMVDGVMFKYLVTRLKLKSEAGKSALNELDNFMGVGMVANSNNCLEILEQRMFWFFFTDEDKLTDVYRMHRKEERDQALRKLEKHSYVRPCGGKSEVTDEGGEVIEMDEVASEVKESLNND